MAAAIRRRSWAFPLLGSILLLVFAFLALRPGHRWMDNSGARVPKSRFSMPGLRRVAPLQPRQSGHQNLVFDPVLVYSTFLGGAALGGGSLTGPSQAPLQLFAQGVAAITVDRSGNLLVGGATTAADFPVTTGVVQPNNPQNNSVGFLSKINPAGHLVFSTYLDGMATVASIAVDASGNIYVAGISNPSGVPQAPLAIPSGTSPFDPTPKPISIVKLNSAASTILNATYLGGSAVDAVSGLTLDANGNVYLAGYTTSNDFPTLNPLQGSLGAAGHNVFVTKLNSTLSSLVYSTYLGQDAYTVGAGSQTPTGTANHGIAVDTLGNAYVVGLSGGCAFIAKLNASASSLLYNSNLWCGNPPGTHTSPGAFVDAVAVDASQNAYAAGGASVFTTGLSNSLAPCPPPLPQTHVPLTEITGTGLISEIDKVGTTTFSTCLGLFPGFNGPVPNAGVNDLVLGSSGNIYVVGNVNSDYGIPMTNPIQGVTPMFVAAIDPKTSAILFASGIGAGGSSTNIPTSVAVDSSGNLYAAGFIANPPSFPVFNALQPVPGMASVSSCNGCTIPDGFVLEIAPTDAAAAALTPALLTFPVEPVGTTSPDQTVIIYDMGSAPLTVSSATATADFSVGGNGCGSVVAAAGGTCTVAVHFTPTATGTRNGTLTITDSAAGSPRTVQLTGQGGQGSAALSPSSLSFSSEQVGTTSAAQKITLTNTGALVLQVSHIQTASPFNETNNCGTSIAAAGSCAISVTFTPTTSTAVTGTLTFTDSAPNSPQTVALTGTGATPSIGLGVASGGSASATVAAGTAAAYTLVIGGAGMSGTASLTCTGAPRGATCSVPATVELSASSASTFMVNVSTTTRSQFLYPSSGPTSWVWALAILGCLAALFKLASQQLSPSLRWRFAPLLAVALCACGGSAPSPTPANPNGTPAGTYTFVVTAKSGTTTQIQNLTLAVQ